jgi:RimJ/RimL family protein N-acetyltransferase
MDFTGFSVTTDRMLLRPYRADDFDTFADLHGRAEVARYLMWEPRDEQASREALERHARLTLEREGDHLTLAGFDQDTGSFVGEFVLILRSVEHGGGEVGYIVHPDAQGRGLATEGARAMLEIGFEVMGLHRVIGRIDARNASSAAVLTRLGMRREAHFVRNERVKGEWTDEVVYAILAEEWASNIASRSAISTKVVAPAAASTSVGHSPPPNP